MEELWDAHHMSLDLIYHTHISNSTAWLKTCLFNIVKELEPCLFESIFFHPWNFQTLGQPFFYTFFFCHCGIRHGTRQLQICYSFWGCSTQEYHLSLWNLECLSFCIWASGGGAHVWMGSIVFYLFLHALDVLCTLGTMWLWRGEIWKIPASPCRPGWTSTYTGKLGTSRSSEFNHKP
jgi:hypothetical protein